MVTGPSDATGPSEATLKSLRNKIIGTEESFTPVKTFATTPTGRSEETSSRETSSPMDVTVETTSEEIQESVILSQDEEEKLLASQRRRRNFL
jgi:hypothetical protein